MRISLRESEIATYVPKIEWNIENDTSEPAFLRHYRKAQLLIAQGLFYDSLPLLHEAMVGIRPKRTEFIWERTYVSIGGLLANVLDYSGQFDEAEAVYAELLLTSVNGEYISGYAIFMHKRRKNFDEAQW